VIPGKYGRKRTQKEVEDSASGSYSNLQKMKEHGLNPIPVFHQGESPKWLERMLKDGETYIGISSAKDLPVKEQKVWLDEMFTILTDSKGVPFIKTHGFGMMSVSILLRYSFYTVDSTSWALGGGYGKILVPTYKNGDYDYTKKPVPVIMSGEVNSSKSAQKMQFDWRGPFEQDFIRKFIEEICEVSMVDVRCDPTARHICWLKYYMELCDHIIGNKFKYRQGVAVPSCKWTGDSIDKDFPWKLKMMFATNTGTTFSNLMNSVGATNRLLNYYELRDKPPELLQKYVKDGVWKQHTNKPQKLKWDNIRYRSKRRMAMANKLENGNGPQGVN